MNKKTKYILSILFTISGFILAAVLNILIPQKADVIFEQVYIPLALFTPSVNL